jgi:hypothetical protein
MTATRAPMNIGILGCGYATSKFHRNLIEPESN